MIHVPYIRPGVDVAFDRNMKPWVLHEGRVTYGKDLTQEQASQWVTNHGNAHAIRYLVDFEFYNEAARHYGHKEQS